MDYYTFTLEAPYVCAFAANTSESILGFFTDTYNTVTTYSLAFDSLYKFETREAALIKAREINPTCEKNYIYGPLPLVITGTPVEPTKQPVDCFPGDTLTLKATVDCPEEPTAVLKYTWSINSVVVADATTDTFSYVVKEDDTGSILSIVCLVNASAPDLWTGQTNIKFFYSVE